MPKGKSIGYYSKTRHGLGCSSASKPYMNVPQQDSSENIPTQSSSTSGRDSDYGLRRLFQRMIVNMVSATLLD